MTAHIPVLLRESVECLAVKPGGVYADLTLGMGGHAAAILERLGPDGRLVGFDKDSEAIETAGRNLARFSGSLTIFKAGFTDAPGLLRGAGIERLDGFIMDLGVSMLQLKKAERGFSFLTPAPLDMRMDQGAGQTAADVLLMSAEKELADIIYRYGEERWARTIARRIVERRSVKPLSSTTELAELVKGAIPKGRWPQRIHPATRTFQALRIAVNDEMNSLARTLDPMIKMLTPGGRAVVISYHSLEDRIVKQTFKAWAKGCDCPPDFPRCVCGKKPGLKVLTGRPVTPADDEIVENPAARSAKLRAAERI